MDDAKQVEKPDMPQAGRYGDRSDLEVVREPVDINKATREELRMIKGLGDARADQIVEWRERNGPFETIGDLQHLPLIDADVLDQVRDYLKV